MYICRKGESVFGKDYAKHLQIKAQHYKLQLMKYVLFELRTHERLLKQEWWWNADEEGHGLGLVKWGLPIGYISGWQQVVIT